LIIGIAIDRDVNSNTQNSTEFITIDSISKITFSNNDGQYISIYQSVEDKRVYC